MTIRLSIALLALALVAATATAGEPLVLAPGKGNVSIYAGAAKASRYYGINGDLRRYDTNQTEFGATTLGVAFNYGVIEDLELNAEIPIGYFFVTSKYRFPDRSIFSPVYYGLGATYQIGRGKVNGSISAMVKIPPGFHHGIYDDPNHPTFLSDGFLQVTGMLNFGFTLKDTWFKGSAGYNWRDEEPLDEIIYNAELGLSKVEGTGIFAGCNGVISTGDVSQPLRPFYAGSSGGVDEQMRIDGGQGRFSTIDRETYFAINAGAYVTVFDRFLLSGRYIVRLFGKNSLALQGAYAGVGYNF